MSADDTTRAGRGEVGEALVAALGFEPTSNLTAGGADALPDEGAEAALDRLAATRTVPVPNEGGGPSNGRSGGRGSTNGGSPNGGSPNGGSRNGGDGSSAASARSGGTGSSTRSGGGRADTPGPGSRRGGRGPKDASDGVPAPPAPPASPPSSSAQPSAPTRSGTAPVRGPGTRGGRGVVPSKALSTAADAAQRARDERAKAAGRVADLDSSGVQPVVDPSPPSGSNGGRRATGDDVFSPPGPLVTTPITVAPPPPPASADFDATPEAGWPGHILPDAEATVAAPQAPPAKTPPPPPPGAGDSAPVGAVASGTVAVARSNLNGGGAGAGGGAAGIGGLAGDLASKMPQLVGDGLRGRSKVRARKVRRVVRHIDPWSVLTFSVLFHLCLFAALLLASVLVWNAAEAAGTISNVENFIRELGDYQTYEIKGDVVFRAAMIIAGILTLASSVMVVLLTVVFNLISDLVGGIRVTVVEEEAVKVHRR